jgi:hypothetical protein
LLLTSLLTGDDAIVEVGDDDMDLGDAKECDVGVDANISDDIGDADAGIGEQEKGNDDDVFVCD